MKPNRPDISARWLRAVRDLNRSAPYNPEIAAEDISAGRYRPAAQSSQFWPSLRAMVSCLRLVLPVALFAIGAALAVACALGLLQNLS